MRSPRHLRALSLRSPWGQGLQTSHRYRLRTWNQWQHRRCTSFQIHRLSKPLIEARHPVASSSHDIVHQAKAQKRTTASSAAEALPAYKPPSDGLLSMLPAKWVPFGELMRLDKPAGTNYLFFPCLFSTLLGACYTGAPTLLVLKTTALFYSGALVMRGAGCTINDLWDRNLDPQVSRTRLRPMARRAVTPSQAIIFFGGQSLVGLAILLQFPAACLYSGIPSLLLVTTYPLAKRVTHYPQFVLGLTFSWGAIMGFPALGVDMLADTPAFQAVAALYGSCVAWCVLYDMIYAHMDIRDDVKAGIKSLSLKYAKQTKTILCGLGTLQIGLLSYAGLAIGASPVFFLGSCAPAALSLALMISKVNLKDPASCWWWFRNGGLITGGAVSFGMALEYANGLLSERDEDEKPKSHGSLDPIQYKAGHG